MVNMGLSLTGRCVEAAALGEALGEARGEARGEAVPPEVVGGAVAAGGSGGGGKREEDGGGQLWSGLFLFGELLSRDRKLAKFFLFAE